MTERRFPPPWSIEELDACFVVRDRDGQSLVCFLALIFVEPPVYHLVRVNLCVFAPSENFL
jgi:hypothetical protein